MRKSTLKNIREALTKDLASCVLITCEYPENNGQMKVELNYHGDPTLVSFLLQGAQQLVDEETELTEQPQPALSFVK